MHVQVDKSQNLITKRNVRFCLQFLYVIVHFLLWLTVLRFKCPKYCQSCFTENLRGKPQSIMSCRWKSPEAVVHCSEVHFVHVVHSPTINAYTAYLFLDNLERNIEHLVYAAYPGWYKCPHLVTW